YTDRRRGRPPSWLLARRATGRATLALCPQRRLSFAAWQPRHAPGRVGRGRRGRRNSRAPPEENDGTPRPPSGPASEHPDLEEPPCLWAPNPPRRVFCWTEATT